MKNTLSSLGNKMYECYITVSQSIPISFEHIILFCGYFKERIFDISLFFIAFSLLYYILFQLSCKASSLVQCSQDNYQQSHVPMFCTHI